MINNKMKVDETPGAQTQTPNASTKNEIVVKIVLDLESSLNYIRHMQQRFYCYPWRWPIYQPPTTIQFNSFSMYPNFPIDPKLKMDFIYPFQQIPFGPPNNSNGSNELNLSVPPNTNGNTEMQVDFSEPVKDCIPQSDENYLKPDEWVLSRKPPNKDDSQILSDENKNIKPQENFKEALKKSDQDKNLNVLIDELPGINYESEQLDGSQLNYSQKQNEDSVEIENKEDDQHSEDTPALEDDEQSIDFETKCAEIRLLHFLNLNKLLIQVFSGDTITDKDWNLSPIEEKILNAVLRRKFYGKVQMDGIYLDESNKFNFINQLARINTLKRPKDCYKMLLGRLFRILKRNYFEKHKFSNQNVYLFYQYYFGDLAKKENLPIQAYFYPFERNNKFISLFPKISHHLNFRYYEKIFKSERLTRDIRIILNKVYDDHFLELKFKFTTLLKKWEKLFYNFDNDLIIVEKTILKYLQHNNRCKIPFTITEIENSIKLFEKMVGRFEH